MTLIGFLVLVLVVCLVLSLIGSIPYAMNNPNLGWTLRVVVIVALIFLILEFFGFVSPRHWRSW